MSASRSYSVVLDGVEAGVVATLVIAVAMVLIDVVTRNLLGISLIWAPEVAGLSLSVLMFVGSAIALRYDAHPRLELVIERLSAPARQVQEAVVSWLIVAFAVFATVAAFQFALAERDARTPILGMSRLWIVAPAVVGFGLTGVIAASRLRSQPRQAVRWSALVVAVALGGLAVTHAIWQPFMTPGVQIVVVWASVVGLFLLGVPIGYAIGLASTVYLFVGTQAPPLTLALTMSAPVSNYVLLAIPFFVLAGAVINRGQLAARLVNFLLTLMGHLRGGLLHAVVVAIYIESGVSGSKFSDMTMVAGALTKTLREKGYRSEDGAAVLAAAAAMGETVPPSNNALVLASITSLSVGALFAAGILPAAVIAILLMVAIAIHANRSKLPAGEPASPREVLTRARAALLPLVMPVVLIGGLVFGIATPTEIAAVAVGYGLFVALLVLKDMPLGAVYPTFRDTVISGGMVLLMIGATASFSWSLSLLGVPGAITSLALGLPNDRVVFLLVSSLLLVVVGSVFEGLPALLVFAPLLLPAAEALGIPGLHFGILLIIATSIGVMSPPLGVGFYIACGIAGAPSGATMRPMMPYVAILVVGLLVVALLPEVTLLVPRALNLPIH